MAPKAHQFQSAIIKSTRLFTIAGVIIGLGILIAGALVARSRLVYQECLKTWPADQQKAVIERYRLTKEDFCRKAYALSDYFSLRENIAEEIRSSGPYQGFPATGSTTEERAKYFNNEFKNRLRQVIKPEEIENPSE